jgi:uncharacterized protein DUF2213
MGLNLIQLKGLVDKAGIHLGERDGKPYLIVPVVAMVGNSVVRPANAEHKEYVPAEVLEDSLISGWNGRPVTYAHPKKSGVYISANSTPDTFDQWSIGQIYESRFDDNKLKMEMWIDKSKCTTGDGLDTLTKLEAGEIIDVSIGARVEVELESGKSPSGEEYGAKWVKAYSDHIACLPNGEGACNQSMGCGAPRVNQSGQIGDNNMPVPITEESKPVIKPKLGFFQSLLARFRPNTIFNVEDSYTELRDALASALKKIEPGLDWVCDFNDSEVYYSTYTIYPGMGYDGTYLYWRRTYSKDANGSITFNNDTIKVKPKQVWETVDEIVASEANKQDCECQKEKGDKTMALDRKALISKLIACEKNKFTESDRKGLEALSDTGLQALDSTPPVDPGTAPEVKAESTSTPVQAATTPIPVTPSPVTPPVLTEEQALAALPSLKSMVDKYRAAETAHRETLITSLKSAQTVYTETQLTAMSTDQLESTAKLVGLDQANANIDYSLTGLAEAPSVNKTPIPADPWLTGLAARRKTTVDEVRKSLNLDTN